LDVAVHRQQKTPALSRGRERNMAYDKLGILMRRRLAALRREHGEDEARLRLSQNSSAEIDRPFQKTVVQHQIHRFLKLAEVHAGSKPRQQHRVFQRRIQVREFLIDLPVAASLLLANCALLTIARANFCAVSGLFLTHDVSAMSVTL
jgi:hypothetical protein